MVIELSLQRGVGSVVDVGTTGAIKGAPRVPIVTVLLPFDDPKPDPLMISPIVGGPELRDRLVSVGVMRKGA